MTSPAAKIQECLREARTEAATLRIEKANLQERVNELRKELDQCLLNARSIAKAHAEQVARLKGEIAMLREIMPKKDKAIADLKDDRARLEQKLHDVGALGFAP